MAPLDMTSIGSVAYVLVFGAIGFGFGAVLEMAGFGDTRKLAAQFYLRDMTVLKVMFTAIVVAAILIALATTFGVLDPGRIWVNPTYLWPGIAGGLVMGVGFVVGGFCPGTSLVAASTLKVDGMVFVLGGLVGVYLFGETVGDYESFFLSSNFGRFTLPEWLGLPLGTTVLLVVLMALAMFVLAEVLERRFSTAAPVAAPRWRRGLRVGGAAGLLVGALVLVARGEPDAAERWAWASPALHHQLEAREMLVHPAEVVALRQDTSIAVDVFDLRSEHDFNLFHLGVARRVDPARLEDPTEVARLLDRPASSVLLLVGNGETGAIAAWKSLTSRGVPNVYVIEGGINEWLGLYPPPACVAQRRTAAEDELGWRFAYAAGASLPAASPELVTSKEFRSPCDDTASSAPGAHTAEHEHGWPAYAYTKHVKLKTRAVVKGGCG